MKKILLLLSMLMFIFTATVSAASAVFLKNQWYEPSEGTAEYVRVFTTDNPDYYRYINDRFAFAINLPANFNQPSRALTAMAVFLRMNTVPALLSAAVIIWE